ncbi:hypothetical protein R1flu_001517 [Riccia fluitans]|uniref:Uncharacterized protein n=1 Tax=Riccia fluitans TaxID=41844 RepID=A0ABD1Y3I7_9MARC
MSRNIHLYHLRGKEQSMISMGLIGFKEGDTLLSLRQKLENIRIFESVFQFWDSRLGSPIHTKLEALIFVEDLEGKVVLVETKDSEESNLVLVGPRVKTEPPVIATQLVKRNLIYKEQNEEIVDVSIGSSKSSITGNDRLEGKALFLSKCMSHAAETAWHSVGPTRCKEQIELFRLKRRVCTLMSQTCKVAQIAGEFAKRKDIVSFLRNICNAHKNGAFGGREALWEFLCDVGRNMNKAAKDYQYSKSTQAIQQALFQFGGQQVVNCMSMNLLTPSLRTVKRNRSTFVPFLLGLQDSNFGEVAKILTAAKALHGITGDVVVILAEDETWVKPTVR